MNVESLLEKLRTEMEQWNSYARLEDSPLAGNIVKAAQYRGTAAGLLIAINMIDRHAAKAKTEVEP